MEVLNGTRQQRLLDTVRLVSPTVVALTLILRSSLLELPFEVLTAVCVVLALSALAATVSVSRLKLWAAASCYLLVFIVFHFGVAILTASNQSVPAFMSGYTQSWFNAFGAVPEALYLSALACWCFTTGCAWRAGDNGGKSTPSAGVTKAAGILGSTLVITGTTILFGYLAMTMPSLILGAGGSQAFWAHVEGSTVALIANPLIIYGSILLAISERSALRTVAVVLLIAFGLWALAVGARTAIMYPVLAMLVVAARRRPRMPSSAAAVVVFMAGLAVVAFVGQARLQGGYEQQASLDPRVALAEMGSSLRPVVEVVTYRRMNNEPLMYGQTYISFGVRSVEGALGLPRPDGLTDPRIAGNEFRGRLDGYQIGYSAVAEAFRNWGTAGVVIVFIGFGALLGHLDRRRSTSPYSDFAVGVVFYVLTYHVRQPSVSILANVAIALLVAAAWRALVTLTQRSGRPSETLLSGDNRVRQQDLATQPSGLPPR